MSKERTGKMEPVLTTVIVTEVVRRSVFVVVPVWVEGNSWASQALEQQGEKTVALLQDAYRDKVLDLRRPVEVDKELVGIEVKVPHEYVNPDRIAVDFAAPALLASEV